MKNHIEPIDVGKKPLICKTCDIKFEIEASLVNHLKPYHVGKELFKCPIKYLQGVNKKMDPPKSDCKHKLVLQIGLYCIV